MVNKWAKPAFDDATMISNLSLQSYLISENPDLLDKLNISLSTCWNILGIHHQRMIHMDINPQTVFIDPETMDINIPISSRSIEINDNLKEETTSTNIDGDLHYISPEQTGRVDIPIDIRSDYYSLGALLYTVFTGMRLFKGEDPAELIHCQIAKQPVEPEILNSAIPKTVSNIIMKLLEKSPDDRYQSITGLIADLEHCIRELVHKKTIGHFAIGESDSSSIFIIPEKLYGRYHEIQLLMKEYQQSSTGNSSVALVSGPPGIGKSFLIHEISSFMTQKKGYFISGKFDQYKKDIPYSAFAEAFQDLIHQILTESDDNLTRWKKILKEAVGDNGQVLIDIIPEMQIILGRQTNYHPASPHEMQNRFNFTFQNFIRAVSKEANPLILHLDDLQWADSASINLLNLIYFDQSLKNIFSIGTFRDIEARENELFSSLLNELEKEEMHHLALQLGPVDEEYLKMLLTDAIAIDTDQYDNIIAKIIKKTNGNPLFIKELLINSYESGFLKFKYLRSEKNRDNRLFGWEFDTEGILSLELSDSVLDIITSRIKRLPFEVEDILKIAACIGVYFDLNLLSELTEIPNKEIISKLEIVIRENMIAEHDNGYIFVHDRIQEAAYNLMDKEDRLAIHYKIGRIFLQGQKEFQPSDTFTCLHQLNIASQLITSQEEKIGLAYLNLHSAIKAKESSAIDEAFFFLKKGIEMLDDNSWKNHYQLSLDLYTELAEISFLSGDYKRMHKCAALILKESISTLDTVRIYSIKIRYYSVNAFTAHDNPDKAVTSGISILKKLGVSISQKPLVPVIFLKLLFLRFKLTEKKTEELLNSKSMTDPKKNAIVSIFSQLLNSSYMSNPLQGASIIIKSLQLAFKYGHSLEHPLAYCAIAVIINSLFGDIKGAYRIGKFALKLAEKQQNESEVSRVLFGYYLTIHHWKEHQRKSMDPLLDGYRKGLKSGNFESASFNLLIYDIHSIYCSMELSKLEKKMAEHNQQIYKYNQLPAYAIHKVYWHFVNRLANKSTEISNLENEIFSNEKMISLRSKDGHIQLHGHFFYIRMQLRFLLYKYSEAFLDLNELRKHFNFHFGNNIIRAWHFYDSLIMLSLYPSASAKEKRKYLKRISLNQKKLKKWAKHAPMNNLHRFNLVEAEKAGILGNHNEAEKLYRKAIQLSIKFNYLSEEAIANEMAAKFYLSRNLNDEAEYHLKDAYNCYKAWGCRMKLLHLEQTYPHILYKEKDSIDDTQGGTAYVDPLGKSISSSTLDVKSVSEISQTIINENDSGTMLQNLLNQIIINYGARKGVLLTIDKGDLSIVMAGIIENNETQYINNDSFTFDDLPESILRYVTRTGKDLVLAHAEKDQKFSNDSYFQKNRVKSALCMAINMQEQIVGIIYLENNLFPGVFTDKRLAILKGLTAHIALVFENLSNKQSKISTNTDQRDSKPIEIILKNEYLLTPQEITIALMLKDGTKRQEVCDELNISYNTLKNHLKVIYDKTINIEDDFETEGRVDKLSRLILFLFRL